MSSDFGVRIACVFMGAGLGFLLTASLDVGNKLISQSYVNGVYEMRIERLERDIKFLSERL